jgi:ribosomal protein S18 acetylase RimI-like enzyme
MEIIRATEYDVSLIHDLAVKIWWPTYKDILSEQQISSMLEDMYSESALRRQMQNGVVFILMKRNDLSIAFAGYSIEKSLMKILKLYIIPSEQGKGVGKMLIDHLEAIARKADIRIIELHVNRANPATGFYLKTGFSITKAVDIPYHQFILDDFVMQKVLRPRPTDHSV